MSEFKTTHELLAAIIRDDPALPHAHGDIDMSSLPTFGGAEPDDTAGVWSWDADNLLVGEGMADLEIIDRTVYDMIR